MGECGICSSSKGSLAKQKFVSGFSKVSWRLTLKSPVTRNQRERNTLSSTGPRGLGSALSCSRPTHVCHTASDTGQQPSFREMYRNVEVCYMRMSPLIEQYIVRFEIAVISQIQPVLTDERSAWSEGSRWLRQSLQCRI
jgi:hypothetical protein